MSQSILQISDDLLALDEIMSEANGNVDDPQVDAILCKWAEDILNDLESKADNYCALMRMLQLRGSARKEEATRLRDRSKVDESAFNGLRRRLQMVFERHGISKLETKRFQISLAKNGGVQPLEVDPTRIGLLPDDCKRITVEPETNVIRQRLMAGEDLPGCRLLDRGVSLRIR